MRLICGLLQLDGGTANEGMLRRMAVEMQGPGLRPVVTIWTEGPIGLALIDFSENVPSALPTNADGIILADVRLDERDSLARACAADVRLGDDALLCSAVEALGPERLEGVMGDFAFGFWNRRTLRLTCARDIFGVRPLAYIHRPNEMFAFASFPKAFHGAGIVPKVIDETNLARFVTFASTSDGSLIAGIKRLPPAHYLEVSREGAMLRPYFQFKHSDVGNYLGSPEEAAAEMRRLIVRAVECRLPKSGAAAAHVSGGLDSSALAILAARHLRARGRRLMGFSRLDRQRNDITVEDETEFVQSVLEQEPDIEWTPVRPPARFLVAEDPIEADKIVQLWPDEPENVISATARARGVDIILSGLGGDEAASFGGNGVIADLFLKGRWKDVAREVVALRRERGWSILQILRGHVVSNLAGRLLPPLAVEFVRRALGRDRSYASLLQATLAPSIRRSGVARRRPFWGQASVAQTRLERISTPHLPHLTEVYALAGARHGLAYAFPLLDRRVVAFALSLPNEFFLRGGFGRRVYRDAMEGVLPDKVRLRHDKRSPAPSLGVDIAAGKNDLLARVEALAQNAAVRSVIDTDRLRREIAQFPSADAFYNHLRRGGLHPDTPRMMAVMRALRVAAYIKQHSGGSGAGRFEAKEIQKS